MHVIRSTFEFIARFSLRLILGTELMKVIGICKIILLGLHLADVDCRDFRRKTT